MPVRYIVFKKAEGMRPIMVKGQKRGCLVASADLVISMMLKCNCIVNDKLVRLR